MVTKKLVIASIVSVLALTLSVAPVASATGRDHDDKDKKDHKVGICHATGSKTNPYVFIHVDKHAAEAHKKHQDGRDIIGVKSKDDCPKAKKETKKETGYVSGDQTAAPKKLEAPKAVNGETVTELPKTGAGLGVALAAGASTISYAVALVLSRRSF